MVAESTIIVDEILESDIDLVNRDDKYEDLTLGGEIDWPKYRTLFD